MLDRQTFLRPIAHRGLHNAAHGIIENTGPAFEAAIAKAYGIECDVRPVAGGLPIIFHDATLDRLIEGEGQVADLTASALKSLRHRISNAPILTLAEMLELIRGRVPLLIEIKSEWTTPDPAFLDAVTNLTLGYEGPVALMSFDPAVMTRIRDLAPRIPRGVISGSYRGTGWWSGKISDERAAALRDLLESGPAAPDFYAYDVNALPTPVTEYVRRVSGLPLFTWTVRTEEQQQIARQWADAMIFEGFEPWSYS
jgi:glycerophosphoryl diester phosphodiesterase